MAGMTVSLVRQQFAVTCCVSKRPDTAVLKSKTQTQTRVLPTSDISVMPQLPQRWGIVGIDHLAITSQILAFKRQHSQSDLNQISVSQLANLMTSGVIMANSAALPDNPRFLVNDGDASEP
jgi:hypothetical protein